MTDWAMTTTWDMRTVQAVRGLGARLVVDGVVLHRARADVLAHSRRRLVEQLVDAARVWAVEVHEGDVEVIESQRYLDVELAVRWRPFWRDVGAQVELRGGHADGEVMTVRRELLHQGIHVRAPLPALSVLEATAADVPDGPVQRTLHYQLAGWREAERRWVLAYE